MSIDMAHDHRDPPREENFVIPADAGPMRFDVGFRAPEGIAFCASQGARLVLIDPAGQTIVDIGGGDQGLSTGCGGSGQHSNAATLPPGEWTVRWSGQGIVVGYVSIVE